MAARKAMMGNPAAAAALVALLVVATASGAAGFVICKVETNSIKSECSSYCTAGSTEAAPKETCCDAVKNADFNCLCGYKDNFRYLAKNMDVGRAMEIPYKCKVSGARPSCS